MKIILTQNQNNFPPNSFSQSRKRRSGKRTDTARGRRNIVRDLESDDCRQSGRTEISSFIAGGAPATRRDRITQRIQCSLKDAHILAANTLV
jgi:hypothetical protein